MDCVFREEKLTPTLKIVIDESDFLSQICSADDRNLKILEEILGAPIFSLGNELHLKSNDPEVRLRFGSLVKELKNQVNLGRALNEELILSTQEGLQPGNESALKTLQEGAIVIPQGFSKVFPRGLNQARYLEGARSHDVTFGIGPAGTGKTFLAIALALADILSKRRRKLILTRPVVEAGENLGFLPGDLSQKISPYLRPLYDAMEDLVPGEVLARLEDNRVIEVAPLAYMRGRSLKNCFVVLDEAQNTTKTQMKMFLTRLGEGSKAIIT
ncbi:MAG: PhoH family protein, partial [Spirochaetales bacterium]|nr:PhoH family protein [Spirochaetales bacterium]